MNNLLVYFPTCKQIAFILYNPLPGAERWLPDDHDQLMLITSLFVLHMLAVLILMFLFASWIHKVYSRPEHEQDVTYHCILADDATDSLSVHV